MTFQVEGHSNYAQAGSRPIPCTSNPGGRPRASAQTYSRAALYAASDFSGDLISSKKDCRRCRCSLV